MSFTTLFSLYLFLSYKVPITAPILCSSDTNVLYLEFSPSLNAFLEVISPHFFCSSCTKTFAFLNLDFVGVNL